MISREFQKSSKPKRPSPLSIRLSEDEKTRLKLLAGTRSVNAFVKSKVFGDTEELRKTERRQPNENHKAIASALGELGQSRLASNLNQIARLANQGALPLDEELTRELSEACENIKQMRKNLVAALGVRK